MFCASRSTLSKSCGAPLEGALLVLIRRVKMNAMHRTASGWFEERCDSALTHAGGLVLWLAPMNELIFGWLLKNKDIHSIPRHACNKNVFLFWIAVPSCIS